MKTHEPVPVADHVRDVDGAVTQVLRGGGNTNNKSVEARLPSVQGYDVLSVIGSGGMGVVYKARQIELKRIVAMKTLNAMAMSDLEFRGRFYAEAEAIAQLQHPNIIQVFETGTVDSMPFEVLPRPFIALEFVDGGSLADHSEKPQRPEYAAALVEKLSRAVHAAHHVGVIHRDLKPANVLLTRDGEPRAVHTGTAYGERSWHQP